MVMVQKICGGTQVIQLRPYLNLLRPGTLIPPMVGGFLFALMGIRVSGLSISPTVIFFALLNGFLLACSNAISNIVNQVHDRETDRLLSHKKNRPIPSGEVTIDEALSIVVVLMIATLGLAWFFFSPFYGVTLSIILFFTWMYNSPPLRLKNRLFWSNFAIATPRGALGILVAYSAFASPLDSRILIPALAFGIYVYGTNTLKDYEDCEVDAKMGVRNFCTVYGKEKSSAIVTVFLALPYVIFALAGSGLVFLTIPLSASMAIILTKNHSLKGQGILMWKLFYLQYAMMMFLYALPFLL